MSYTLKQVKTGWEIQNGSSITVTVPDLKSVEMAIEMLTKKPAKLDLTITPVAETENTAVDRVLKSAARALTVSEIIHKINPAADADEKKQIHAILSTLGRKKILKRKKNAAGIFEYSVKA